MDNLITALGGLVLAALLLLLAVAILTLPTMWLWNWLMPAIFGLPTIGLWKALGLNIFCSILFKPSVKINKEGG